MVFPKDSPQLAKVFWVQAATGLSICHALEQLGLRPTLKWPNDVLLTGKKVAGILGESQTGVQGLVIIMGLGINIENDIREIIAEFPTLEDKITSVAIEVAKRVGAQAEHIDSISILNNLVNYLDNYWSSDFDINIIRTEWLQYSNLIGKEIKYTDSQGQKFQAKVQEISEYGSLLVIDEKGISKELTVSDIELGS
jgi:BirA family biotin operon repressor/biotin-[acetyl-CoA-carboxylase] ligase